MRDNFLKANFLVIHHTGVAITGLPGVGKSEITLNLLDRGHQFISDDGVELCKIDKKILGSAPLATKNYLFVRNLGMIDVKKIWGSHIIVDQYELQLIINVYQQDHNINIQSFTMQPTLDNILDISIPKINLPINHRINSHLFIEILVKNYLLQQQGYNTEQELLKKHYKNLAKT